MAYASKAGRARVSSKRPQAQAVCFRCGIWYNRVDLSFQHDWRGTSLRNLYILVCEPCLDVPQEQLRAIQLPADPTPVYFPSVEQFTAAETNYRITVPGCVDPITNIPRPSDDFRVTMDCQNRVTQEIGAPRGLDQNAVMPYNGAIQKHFGVVLSPLSLTANGTATVTATFSAAHGLCTNDQIAVEGLTNAAAAGFFSVTVPNPMMFTYMTNVNVAAGGLLTGTTRMITVLVGLPLGDDQIPQVGQ
jgi:hypothetical protein